MATRERLKSSDPEEDELMGVQGPIQQPARGQMPVDSPTSPIGRPTPPLQGTDVERPPSRVIVTAVEPAEKEHVAQVVNPRLGSSYERAAAAQELTDQAEALPSGQVLEQSVHDTVGAKEASQLLDEYKASYEKLSSDLDTVQKLLAQQDHALAKSEQAITVFQNRISLLNEQMRYVQQQCAHNQPVERGVLEEVQGAIVRITIITLLGGVIGGPLLALAAKALLGPKIVEGVVAGFVAAVSTELANRSADPTSHYHHH